MEMVVQVHPNCTTRGFQDKQKPDGLRKVIFEVQPHYYLWVWTSKPPHLLEDLNLPLTTAIIKQRIYSIPFDNIFVLDIYYLSHWPISLPLSPQKLVSPYIPIPSHNCHIPTKATYLCLKLAIIERFDCVRSSVTGSPNLHKEEGCARFLLLHALYESNWPLKRRCFTQKSCFTSCAYELKNPIHSTLFKGLIELLLGTILVLYRLIPSWST